MIGALVGASSVALAFASASAGANPAAAPIALTATPARVMLTGSMRTVVRVTNGGTKRVVVDARRAGFALDLRGRPRIVRRGDARSAAGWLTLRPNHFALAPHATGSLVVESTLPRRAEPGDHDALVLLSTRPVTRARVAVRARVGVTVVVRARGRILRRLELRGLRVTRRGRRRALELVVVNRGNVTESLGRGRAVLSLARSGRPVATLVARRRDLRPGTRGIVEFRFRSLRRGWVIARVVIPASNGRRALRRTYRIRL